MKSIGILPGDHQSYIDHLLPLCLLLNIPILVTDRWIQHLIEQYYPPIPIILAEAEDFDLDPYLKEYDLFVYVDFFRRGNGSFQFQEYLSRKRARSVMCLHGNPDKYRDIYWLENLSSEDIILAYGPQLQGLMKEKKIDKNPLRCGNFRLECYKEYENEFDQKLPFTKSHKPTLLYAPTWSVSGRLTEHRAYFSPFFDIYRKIFDTLSDKYQLIVKLHPHAVKMMPDRVAEVMREYPQIHFLRDFPLIYPLLKVCDLYLGDYSSIGYDFLYFDRPLFFLETQKASPLQHYGSRITLSQLPLLDEKPFPRKELYDHVFGPPKSLNSLKEEIENACRSHPR